jgi:hypothetical protein
VTDTPPGTTLLQEIIAGLLAAIGALTLALNRIRGKQSRNGNGKAVDIGDAMRILIGEAVRIQFEAAKPSLRAMVVAAVREEIENSERLKGFDSRFDRLERLRDEDLADAGDHFDRIEKRLRGQSF